MTRDELLRIVRSIGKRCFIKCYDIASKKGDNLTKEDLIKHDPDLQGTTRNALSTRLSRIKKIFREGRQDDALEMARSIL